MRRATRFSLSKTGPPCGKTHAETHRSPHVCLTLYLNSEITRFSMRLNVLRTTAKLIEKAIAYSSVHSQWYKMHTMGGMYRKRYIYTVMYMTGERLAAHAQKRRRGCSVHSIGDRQKGTSRARRACITGGRCSAAASRWRSTAGCCGGRRVRGSAVPAP